MEKIKIEINDKIYSVEVMKTEAEKSEGLSNRDSLTDDQGMLFDFSDDPQKELTFNSFDMKFPIDIIFINQDMEVCAIDTLDPGPDGECTCIADDDEEICYVLEVNAGSLIKVGDEFEFVEDETDDMYMLDESGQPYYIIKSGARIFSRIHTRKLIKAAKKAKKSKNDKDYKKLGKLMFKILDIQEDQADEYVELPDKE